LFLINFIQEEVHHSFRGVGEWADVVEKVQEPIIAVLQIGKHTAAEIQRTLEKIHKVDCSRFLWEED